MRPRTMLPIQGKDEPRSGLPAPRCLLPVAQLLQRLPITQVQIIIIILITFLPCFCTYMNECMAHTHTLFTTAPLSSRNFHNFTVFRVPCIDSKSVGGYEPSDLGNVAFLSESCSMHAPYGTAFSCFNIRWMHICCEYEGVPLTLADSLWKYSVLYIRLTKNGCVTRYLSVQ